MGRRKIEIQPITHERNRSVTFLKRKNGLFKKAYELGVLCSVDVAVIIFEERPGHHVKCYEYCSSDIRGIVDRHIRFEGERDTKTPIDFGNNKLADVADDDGDDDDEDDGTGRKRPGGMKKQDGKRVGQGKTDASMNLDVDYRPLTIPPAPLHQLHLASGTTGNSSLPISGERHNPASAHGHLNKRPRLAPSVPTDDRHLSGVQSPNPNSGTFPYDHDPNGYRLPPYPVSHSHPHAFPALFSAPNVSTPPPGPPFLDFGRAQHPHQPARTVSFPPSAGQGFNVGGQRHSLGQGGSLPGFLDTGAAQGQGQNSGHRQPGQGQGQFSPFDWPVHAGGPHQQHPNSAPPHPTNAHDNAWLDFLSGAGPQPDAAGAASGAGPQLSYSHPPVTAVTPTDANRRASVSWERQQHESRPGSATISPSLSNKRPRADSSAEGSVTGNGAVTNGSGGGDASNTKEEKTDEGGGR